MFTFDVFLLIMPTFSFENENGTYHCELKITIFNNKLIARAIEVTRFLFFVKNLYRNVLV